MTPTTDAAAAAEPPLQPPQPQPQLRTMPGFDAPDEFYAALIAAHQGLGDAESHVFNARLVLLLANHIGSMPVLQQALAAARSPI